jgi:hypothetical protein
MTKSLRNRMFGLACAASCLIDYAGFGAAVGDGVQAAVFGQDVSEI